MASGICTSSKAAVLGAFADPQAWGAGTAAGSDRHVEVFREGQGCVLSTKIRTEAPRMPVFREQGMPGLGEASRQAHYRVESQQSHEDRCRQVLRWN